MEFLKVIIILIEFKYIKIRKANRNENTLDNISAYFEKSNNKNIKFSEFSSKISPKKIIFE
jgi:hypothetical protein